VVGHHDSTFNYGPLNFTSNLNAQLNYEMHIFLLLSLHVGTAVCQVYRAVSPSHVSCRAFDSLASKNSG
jgi:hypothetical protein